MADRGFVPERFKEPETRAAGQVEGQQIVTGLARAPGTQALFVPDNSPEKNSWFWRDLEGMASSALSAEEIDRLVPFFVELDAAPVPGGWPKGGVTRLKLPNKHLQYAGTWFGLAGTLLVVFAVYLRGRLRARAFT
jgi:surfeit locus 1 family protein